MDFNVYIERQCSVTALVSSCSCCLLRFCKKNSRMALLISFLIGIQLFHAAVSVPIPQFLHASCNSLEVKTAAELALNKANKYKTEGYVIGLQRIFEANKVTEGDESVFFLTLDVLETKCHALSRKSWKECEFRHPYETVFGQCKVIIKVNKNSNDTFMYRNDCILHPHSSPSCPGCPIRQNPSEERFQEIARESLAKFNAEHEHDHYFAIVKVTKATSQVVHGILNAIEFTIHETSCRKSTPVSNLTQCPLLPSSTAERGLCKGSVIGRADEDSKIITANCQLFPHASESEEQEIHHVTSTDIPTKQKEAEVQAVTHHPPTKRAVRDVQEPNPTFYPTHVSHISKSLIPSFPEGLSQSPSCPGEAAIQIPGLQLPSEPNDEFI